MQNESEIRAKSLINDYCLAEFGSAADFSVPDSIGIGYTTITDEEIPIQAFADIINFKIEKYLMDCLVECRQYTTLEELIEAELVCLSFDELTCVGDAQIELFYAAENT